MINITFWKRTKMGGVGAAQTPRHTQTHAHTHARTHLSYSCSRRDPVKMCIKSCHSSAQSPPVISHPKSKPKPSQRPQAFRGLPPPFLSLALSAAKLPFLPGLSVAPEHPGTLLPWGLGIAIPSAWNAFSPDVCLLGLLPLLPVFAQMPSCW